MAPWPACPSDCDRYDASAEHTLRRELIPTQATRDIENMGAYAAAQVGAQVGHEMKVGYARVSTTEQDHPFAAGFLQGCELRAQGSPACHGQRREIRSAVQARRLPEARGPRSDQGRREPVANRPHLRRRSRHHLSPAKARGGVMIKEM